jgi:hypothetical protein
MLALTRETLLARLLLVPGLADRYQRREPDFPAAVAGWLRDGEQALARLRSPLASLCAAERARLLAGADGGAEPGSGAGRGAPRKALRALAAGVLNCAEAALREALAKTDGELASLRDKLAQLLAVASGARPLALPAAGGAAAYAELWRQLGELPEARSLHAYLGVSLAPPDRQYLLDDLLGNLIQGTAALQ